MYRNAFLRFHCTAPRLRSKKLENGAYSGRIAAKHNVFLQTTRLLSHDSEVKGVPGRGRAGAPLFGRFPFSWFSAIFCFLAFLVEFQDFRGKRENPRKWQKTQKSWNFTKVTRKCEIAKTRKTGIGRKGGPQPGPARGPPLLLNVRWTACPLFKKHYVLQWTGWKVVRFQFFRRIAFKA